METHDSKTRAKQHYYQMEKELIRNRNTSNQKHPTIYYKITYVDGRRKTYSSFQQDNMVHAWFDLAETI